MASLAPVTATRSASFMVAAIVLCTLLAYRPAMSAGYVWDDDYHLTESVIVKDNALYRIWCTTEMANYWPISWTSYWLEYQLWGLEPAGYHIVNVLIHIASALLVFRILARLNVPAASFAALVFAIHPVNVESVAWISQRRNVLSLFFYLAALLCYLHVDASGHAKKWYGLAVACFVLAMLSKGSAVGLPVVLLMCALWTRGTLSRRDLVRCLPFFVIAFLFSVVEIWFQYVRAIGEIAIRDDGFFARLAGAGWAVWFYLYKTAWPVTLSFVYPRWQIGAMNPASYVPDGLLVVLLALCWWFRRSWGRPVLFGLGYFMITLGPFLGFFTIFFMRYSYVADHYVYHALIGMIALAVAGGWQIAQRDGRPTALMMKAVAVSVVIALGMLTWQRCHVYHDAETLWRDTLRKNPNCWLAHNDLGNLLWVRGRFDEATAHFLRAIEIHPEFPETHYNFGALLEEQGRIDDAVDHFRQAVRINRNMAPAHSKLAEILRSRGLLDEAADHYREMIRIDPQDFRSENKLGLLLHMRGKLREATQHFQNAVLIKPDDPLAHFNLGNVLAARGRFDDAIDSFREAIRLKPDFTEAKKRLRRALADQ